MMPNDKNYARAKILIRIPIVVFAITAICIGTLAINYFSTGSDVTAVALIFVSTLCMVLTTGPCFVMSVLGTMYAVRAKKEGDRNH